MPAFLSHATHIPWFGPGLCPFRLVGDVCLALSGPWLLYRMKVKGSEGVSLETQILRLITFGARYLDVFFDPPISVYNTIMKFVILVSGLLSVVTLARGGSLFSKAAAKSAVRMSLAILLSVYLATQVKFVSRHFMDIAWTASLYLAIQSDGYQFQATFTTGIMDWQIIAYLVLITAYRVFYLLHWHFRFQAEGKWDPNTVFAAIGALEIQALGFFAITLATIRRRLRKNVPQIASEEGAQSLIDIKAPVIVEEKN